MTQPYDVIVVGLGAMGSATLYQLARTGAHVLGIDQFHPPHSLGSSHGETRIIREANGEGAAYIPLVQRAYQLWQEIGAEADEELLVITGGLVLCNPQSATQFHGQRNFVDHTASLAQKFGIAHELLDARTTQARFPQLRLQGQEIAYYEPGGGILRPERCVQAQLSLAQRHGAHVRMGEKVLSVKPVGADVTVTTANATYKAAKVVLAAGSWIGDLLGPDYARPFTIYRQVFYWFEAEEIASFYPGRFPFIIWIGDTQEEYFSAFPTVDQGKTGVKVCTEEYDVSTTADAIDRTIQPAEIDRMYRNLVARRTVGLTDTCRQTSVCMYTCTPDEEFLIDTHPEHKQIVVASPCSGHGFKHSAAIGEAVSQLVLDGQSHLDLSTFSWARLTR